MRLQNFGHFQNGCQNTEKNDDVWETFRNSILLLSYLVIIYLGVTFPWEFQGSWWTCNNIKVKDVRYKVKQLINH